MESLASSATRVPGFRKRVMVDSDRLKTIVSELKVSIPADMQEAREILTQKDSVINQAHLEARRVKEGAEQEAHALTSSAKEEQAARINETEIVKEAHARAEEITQQAAQEAQEVDTLVTDAVRNFLFGPPGSGGFDLASLNIQRCRDHGLARLNEARKAYGLKHHKKFSDITLNATVQLALEAAYDGGVKDVELWVGILAEDHVAGALVGETGQAILADQFIRLRNGDRFWYQNDPFFTNDDDLLEEVKDTTLVDIIRRNTDIGDEIQDNAFLVP